jgi:hypothetical protein
VVYAQHGQLIMTLLLDESWRLASAESSLKDYPDLPSGPVPSLVSQLSNEGHLFFG